MNLTILRITNKKKFRTKRANMRPPTKLRPSQSRNTMNDEKTYIQI